VGVVAAEPARDVLVYSGWWLRIQGIDVREVPFPAPQGEFPDDGRGQWTGGWTNLRGSGLTVYETATAADGEGPSGTYVSRLRISNFGSAPVTFSVFHYLNPDPDGLSEHEGAFPSSSTPNMISMPGVRVVSGGAMLWLGEVHYRAGGAQRRACRPDDAPLTGLLNDADADDLDGTGLPTAFTPAGVNCAYQWNSLTLNPYAGAEFLVSVSSDLGRLKVKGDADSDNLPDLLLEVEPSPGQVEVWGMRRTVRRANLVTSSPGTTAFDDFDRDFENDLLYRDPTTLIPYIFFRTSGQGPWGWNIADAPTLPANWVVAATADFNADGAADILWRNTTSQKLVIWTMNGYHKIGNIVPVPDAAADANWDVVGAQDVNRDGRVDLLFYNNTSGNVVVWYMDANVQRITGGFTTPPSAGSSAWKVVASGDFGRGTGAERPAVTGGIDLIWQNQVSSKLVVWHMNGAAERTSGGFLTPDGAPGLRVIGPR
jgi:hypothetical protein